MEWVGEADGSAKKELLAKAGCLLVPICWEEPFGLIMVEAMACGAPVVALRRGVVADGVTGIVCDDPTELVQAIVRAGELSPASCRRWARERFDVGGADRRLRTSLPTAAGPGRRSVHAASGRGSVKNGGLRPA